MAMAKYLKKAIERPEENISEVRKIVSQILERVKKEGEAGLRYYSEKFDDWSPEHFRVSKDQILAARESLPASEVEDIDFVRPRYEILRRSR